MRHKYCWDRKFLPDNVYDKEFVYPNEPYYLEITQNKLSIIGLKLNGINLSTLIDNYEKSQIDQFANDDSLPIEDKFVRYCTISAISSVYLGNGISNKNVIHNTFIASYNNTGQKYEVGNQQKAELKNINISNTFSTNAITFYNNVNNYINTQKIKKNFTTFRLWVYTIAVEIVIIVGIFVTLLVTIMIKNNIKDILFFDNKRMIILLFILIISILSLTFLWYFYVCKPINIMDDKVNDWNNAFINGLANKIAVVKKTREDKYNFSSIDRFNQYFIENQSKAFKSYFYYFHFNNATSKSIMNQQEFIAKKDYDEFKNTKKEYGLIFTEYSWENIIIAIILSIFLIALVILLIKVFRRINTINNLQQSQGGIHLPGSAVGWSKNDENRFVLLKSNQVKNFANQDFEFNL